MRSWTTFAVFGGFLVILVVYSFISQFFSNPALRSAQQFLDAVNRNDAAAVEKLVDPSAGKIMKAGNSLISISFAEGTPFDGPFVRHEAVLWGYTELTTLKIDPKSDPHVLEKSGIATIQLTNGMQIYLHLVGRQWKIIYITKGPEK